VHVFYGSAAGDVVDFELVWAHGLVLGDAIDGENDLDLIERALDGDG